ncbi:MAG: Glycosyl hydrolase family 57 [Chloroflexi bacterium ADurb.Bin222]|nr:MAG: Glycosyl hydrolase family 57 [Chloroflexi bacterium ADurb.Bin222]
MRPHWFYLLLLLSPLLSACGTPTPAATPTASPTTAAPATTEAPTAPLVTPEATDDRLYLAIIWHQHQPVYFKDPETGVYAKPWVRLHAAKDYVDMAAMLKAYPSVHVTFNLTPSLLRQLEDLATGAKDAYWIHTEVPAGELTDDQKRFILRYFFDINSKIIQRFPRYEELRLKRPADDAAVEEALAGGWSTQDFLDLQVLFNLGWTDPDWLAQAPLADLVAKGRDFTEADKQLVLDEHLRLIRDVIPVHKALQDAGQIEVTTTPYAHPILPLLVNTALARKAMPTDKLPDPAFRVQQDAKAQLARGVARYQELFGRAPRGMWPGEGSVAEEIVGMVSEAGLRWMASDEGVLAKSLGLDGFSRDSADTVKEADLLYRPYNVAAGDGSPVAIVFRDVVISDKVGFTYSGMKGAAAAEDFMKRLHAIRDQLRAENAAGPHLVTVILDGENAWEHYDNDGKEFLNTLYQLLAADDTILTVTPSEYLERFPQEPSRTIEDLWAGSWINHDFSTWIGEDEENQAWDYLREVRDIVKQYESGKRTPPSAEALKQALDLMFIAEGSDWFWWYGADQNSGDDEGFDRQFRETLKQVLRTLGEEPPDWLDVPIVAQAPAAAEQSPTDLLTPTIDGAVTAGEWDAAGFYTAGGGAMAAGSLPLERLYYGFDAQHLYLRVDAAYEWAALTTCGGNDDCRTTLGFYWLPPGRTQATPLSRWGGTATYLGFGAAQLVELVYASNARLTGVTFSLYDGVSWVSMEFPADDLRVAIAGKTLELAIPLKLVAGKQDLQSGDRIQLRAVLSQGLLEAQADQQLLPTTGPALITVPELGTTTWVLQVQDAENDDYGPGTYTYPTDGVFQPGVFDITSFEVGYDETNIVFRVTIRGPVENVWGSGRGLSVQTLDIYIDQDGAASGERLLLPGRNAALTADHGWDFALWIEGWEGGLYTPGDAEPVKVPVSPVIIADAGQRRITVKVPRSVLGDTPESWQYAVVMLSQDGYPAAGVWRVRDVEVSAAQWRLGGAPAADASHTRIIDWVWPAAGIQEAALSTYKSSANLSALTPDDFAQLQMLSPQ